MLQAIANIVKNPSYPGYPLNDKDPLFQLSQLRPIYQPALTHRPTNWLLFLKITGGFYSQQDSNNLMNGPGNFAIDEFGFVWVNTNYQPRPPDEFACAGDRLIKFYPWGEPVPGTPFTGGGLSGAGYGNTLDPKGRVWIGNFGFQDPPCQFDPSKAAKSNSVSLFRPDGTAISGPDGYTQGNISWPMGTVSDRHGNIWVANCGNDSVTKIPRGDPQRAINIPVGPAPAPGDPQIKPFGAVIDARGNMWTANNRSNTVSIISPDGVLIDTLPGTYKGKTVLSHPIGNALDSKGNVWVANSDWLDAPCPTHSDPRYGHQSFDHSVSGQGSNALSWFPLYRRRRQSPVGDNRGRRRHRMGVQLWHFPAGAGRAHRSPERDQPILRYRYQEMSARHESRRSHIAGYRLHNRCPATDDGRRGRSIRKSLAHEQLEDQCRSLQKSRRERRGDRRWCGCTGEDAGYWTAGSLQNTAKGLEVAEGPAFGAIGGQRFETVRQNGTPHD